MLARAVNVSAAFHRNGFKDQVFQSLNRRYLNLAMIETLWCPLRSLARAFEPPTGVFGSWPSGARRMASI